MTIQSETSKAVYIADGTTTTFEIPFYFFNKEVSVYMDDAATALVADKDYTVTHYENAIGGEVIFNIAPSAESRITILRNVELTQLVAFWEGENFPAQDYENSLDKMIMALQQLKEMMKRTLIMSPGEDMTNEEFYQLISNIHKNFDFLNNLPNLIEEIKDIYSAFGNSITHTVEAEDSRAVSSKGVWNYIQENGTKKYQNLTIASSAIKEDTTYADYPYCAEISIPEAKSTHIPTVVLDIDAAQSGNFAPISEAKDGKVCVYMKEKPTTETLIIPSLVLH